MGILSYSLLSFCVFIIVFGTRALPFLFSKKMKRSQFALYLGATIPLAIMGLLVAHTTLHLETLPCILGLLACTIAHLLFSSTLVSIGVGTAVYVTLIHCFPPI